MKEKLPHRIASFLNADDVRLMKISQKPKQIIPTNFRQAVRQYGMKLRYDPELSRLNGLRWFLHHVLTNRDENKLQIFFRTIRQLDRTLLYKDLTRPAVYCSYLEKHLVIFLDFIQNVSHVQHALTLRIQINGDTISLSMISIILNRESGKRYPLLSHQLEREADEHDNERDFAKSTVSFKFNDRKILTIFLEKILSDKKYSQLLNPTIVSNTNKLYKNLNLPKSIRHNEKMQQTILVGDKIDPSVLFEKLPSRKQQSVDILLTTFYGFVAQTFGIL